MNDNKALQKIKSMSETDLLNLYHGYHSTDEANVYLARENTRLEAELANVAAQLTDAVHRVANLEAELREARGNTQQQAIIDQAKQTLSIESLAAHWEIEKLRKLDQSAQNYNRMANLSWYMKGLGTGYDLLNQPIVDTEVS